MLSKKKFFLIFILFCYSFTSYTIEKKININKLPLIPELSSKDDIFREYTSIVDENYKELASGKEPLMLFFHCKVPKDMNLLSLAARCNIPYETIATLNHINNNTKNLSDKEILIPTVPGIFINEKSNEPLQIILKSRASETKVSETKNSESLQNKKICYNFGTETLIFLQNERFTPTERAYFLDTSLGLPIDTSLSYISSSFGLRKNPFSGEWKTHKGVDFAADEGVPVYAVKNGIISLAKKNDTTFGNYIILKHNDGNSTSVYAHLLQMKVKNGDRVNRGDIIGYVGSTGMATGPHLHFEIRFGGVAEDPEKILPVGNKR